MALKNNYLVNARKKKNDEFYTQYSDIESECNKFRSSFKNKVVYCPCDSTKSKFPEFFKNNFNELGIKGLYYSSIDDDAYYYDGNVEAKISGNIDITKQEYNDMLNKVDVVVTNPPFSLFISFLNGLVVNKKDFLIVGQQNTISCKDVFNHLKNDGVSVDYGFKGIAGWFDVPEQYEDTASSGEHKTGKIRVSGVVWYTSLPLDNEKPFIELKKHYYDENGNPNNDEYPVYDNFREISKLDEDCINVNEVKNIPCDYYGYMGVPISFFGKYNPEQFELIQLDHYGPLGNQDNVVNGKQKYRRLYVRLRKQDN